MLKAIILDTMASESNEVAAMVQRFDKALFERATFERSKKPNGSHIELRRFANWTAGNKRFAAFLVAIKADPETLLNRVRKNGSRTDLKGLKKAYELFRFIMGEKSLEPVSRALFASTIVAAKKGVKWVSSTEQEFILSEEPPMSLPVKVREAIKGWQNKYMTLEGDSRHAACRFRTTMANLGIYSYAKEDHDDSGYQLGVYVDLDHPVIKTISNELGI